jgi:hypothetical protein
MITTEIQENCVRIKINLGLKCNKHFLLFTRNETYEYQAELVANQIQKQLDEKIRKLKEEYYNRGYKDGKGHQTKVTWFSSSRWF